MENRNQEITDYFGKYEMDKVERLECIRELIHDSVPHINEKMWTKVPCFYIDKTSIVIRVFGDHFNIFADTIVQYEGELAEYKITPKGALQIFDNQALPLKVLRKIFSDLSY